jgi:hypothetical protein
MTFVGDDLSIGAEFQESVIGEVNGLGGYVTQQVSASQVPESLNFPPDQPPEPVYLGNSRHVLTGEYYVDVDDMQHFQLWLWNSDSGSLVYTDEMVFEDMEEADAYLPPMVSWIFSHIPVEQQVTVQATEQATEQVTEVEENAEPETLSAEETDTGNGGEGENGTYKRRFFLGLRGAGFLSSSMPQTSGAYEGGISQGFTGEMALMMEFRAFRFLSLQAEGVFVYDTFKAAKKTQKGQELVRSTDIFRAFSLMFPLLVKVPLQVGPVTLSPFMGAYYTMPLGKMTIVPDSSDETTAAYSYRVDPPFGVSLGIDVGFPLLSGEFFAGLRFDRNLGMTIVGDRNRMQYSRNRIGLSLGYEWLLWRQR